MTEVSGERCKCGVRVAQNKHGFWYHVDGGVLDHKPEPADPSPTQREPEPARTHGRTIKGVDQMAKQFLLRDTTLCEECGRLKSGHRVVGGERVCYPDTFPEQPLIFRNSAGLLPCPFCGSEMVRVANLVDVDDYFVQCEGCEVQQIANYTREEAITRWNRRP